MHRPLPSQPGVARAAFLSTAAILSSLVLQPAPLALADGLDPHIQQIMDKPLCQHGQFGLLEVDPKSGKTITSLAPDRFFVPGSTTKLFTVSTGWDTLGAASTLTTPVVTTGAMNGTTLNGDLVLIASGDLTMGGRLEPDGSIDFVPVDHTCANNVPGAMITPENPLAGLDTLAHQVQASGIARAATPCGQL